MNPQDFHCSITVNIPLKESFESITKGVLEWWTKNYEGRSENTGDTFTTRFGETSATFKIQEIIPGKKIVWCVTDCNLHFLKTKKNGKTL